MAALSTIFYALGYLTGIGAFVLMARARRIATSGVLATMQAALIGGLVSANVAQWVFGGTAGKTILGGIAGGYLTVVLFKRKLGLRRHTGDLFAVALCAGEAVGRWGCFFGGCCHGNPSNVAWAVMQHGVMRHPTQIYLSLACVLILAALWAFALTSPPEDGLFCLQGLLYCVARFAIEFYRASPPVAAGLTMAQWACIGGFLFFAVRMRLVMGAQRGSERSDAILCHGV
jgi:phosphatidylglycerol:prolipoprotein diacylglycerol transferase